MIGIILIVIIAVLASSSSFISSAGKVADGRRKGVKAITKKGWITITLNSGVIVISILQYVQNERESERKENDSKRNQTVRDSILRRSYDSALVEVKKKFDTTNIKTILTVTETLGRYGYKLDSANNQLVKVVKDSAKTRVIVPNDPIVKVCVENGIQIIKHTNNVYTFKLLMCSYDASSDKHEIACHIALGDADSLHKKPYYIGSLRIMKDDPSLIKDHIRINQFELTYELPIKGAYFYLVGSYKNFDSSKSYKINQVYYFDYKKNVTLTVNGEDKDDFIAFLKKEKPALTENRHINIFQTNTPQ